MNEPLVSVCLPNLNTLPFLPERFDTIFNQSFQNWELLVYDGYSDDGAWDYIRELAERDLRMRAWQGPREGTLGSWNPCIQRARGEYVYIATSDDAMAPNCLEKLLAALEAHPECDLAHCPLIVVDQNGEPAAEPTWPQCSAFEHGIGELARKPHVRRAPYDGLLHLTGRTVYTSITQLLIRRSLFSRIGYFSSRWGSFGDFNWEMKAGLVANTVHVPDTWATWRVHPRQATCMTEFFTAEHARKIEEMIQDAVRACEAYLPQAFVAGLRSLWLDKAKDMRTYYGGLRQRRNSSLSRRLYQLAQFFGTANVRRELFRRLHAGQNGAISRRSKCDSGWNLLDSVRLSSLLPGKARIRIMGSTPAMPQPLKITIDKH